MTEVAAIPKALRGPALGLAVFAGGLLFSAGGLGFWHWNIGAGIVLTAMIFSQPSRWPWIVLAAGLAWTAAGALSHPDPDAPSFAPILDFALLGCASCVRYFIGHWADPLLCLLPAWWLYRRAQGPRALVSPEGMALLHLVVLAAAILQTVTDILWVLGEGFVADTRHRQIVDHVAINAGNAAELLGAFTLKQVLGYFLGTMLLLPLVLWLRLPALRQHSRRMLVEVCVLLLPATGLFLGLLWLFPDTRLAELLRLLLIVAIVVFAVRHGLRGAAFSVLVVSVALAVEDHLWGTGASVIWLQTFVAIAGAMALMFGASMDQLRGQTAQLEEARRREQRMVVELREAAARSVRAQETERGRLSLELHDSLGQGITALHTQLKLIDLESAGETQRWTAGLRDVARQMRTSLREVLEALRPSALRELGLVKAIDKGVIRQTAEAAGLQFELRVLPDEAALLGLDDALSVAVFRVVQEAVTNVVRHADARNIEARIRRGRWQSEEWLLVSVRDDGRSRIHAVPGKGLQGIRDRAMTLGGGAIFRTLASGGQLKVWFRIQP